MITYVLFGCCVMALFMCLHNIFKTRLRYLEERIFCAFLLSSAIWSFGFFQVLIQNQARQAYFWRAFGMIGVMGYLILGSMLVCKLSEPPKWVDKVITRFSFLGILIYFPIIGKARVTYFMTEFGMSYKFRSDVWNLFYTIYSAVLACALLAVVVFTVYFSKKKSFRVVGIGLTAGLLCLIAGMILDTVMPLFGIPAYPGSTLAQFIGLLVIYRAFVERNRSQIRQENMWEFVCYSMSVPVLVFDTNDNLKLINKSAESFFGMGQNRMEDKCINQLFTLEGRTYDFEGDMLSIDATCRANSIICNLAINKLYDDYKDIIGYIVIVSDLTERMKTVKELEKAMKEAARANEAKSTFLANMSHEIRTPMHAIIGFSELVLKGEINDEVRAHVEDIKLASNNLLAIINDILDISKIESGKMEVVPTRYYTSALMKDVALIISPQAERKGLKFTMNVDPTLPSWLYGDKVHIRGILINILNNAIKYTKEGSITFNVKITLRTDTKVRIQFEIADTGVGIKEEDQATIFQSFERLDRQVHYGEEGSGLGLTIANGYVRLMGGYIRVESTYGEGSTFFVTLEQKILDAKPIDSAYTHQEGIFKGEVLEEFEVIHTPVLVVDDNRINLVVAEGLLKSYGMQVDVADGGAAAIEKCMDKNYPIIFMDQMMPEINGIDAMKEIRKRNPYYAPEGEGKIIVLTADAIGGVRERLLEEGFDDYLGKPLNIKQLERVLIRILPQENIVRKEKKQVEEKKTEEDKISPEQKKKINRMKEILVDLDVELGMGRCGNSDKEYLQILKIAYDYGQSRMEQLREFQEKRDFVDYQIKVHSLKSTALNIGAIEVSKMAQDQEEACKSDDYKFVDDHMEPMFEKYQKVLEQIEVLLTEEGLLTAAKKQEKPVLEEKMAREVMDSILVQLDNFAFDKIFDVLDQLHEYEILEPFANAFARIETFMDELDVESIKQVIKECNEKVEA